MLRRFPFLMKVLILTLCLSLAVRLPAEAVVTTIGANAIKAAVRPLVASMVTKQGVRTTEKAALRKAEEKWFSRMTADQVAAIEKAAQRAEPVAGKSGWLKTTIGVGMWLTGADLVFDLYDMLRSGQQVEYYTADPVASGTLTTGWNGIYMVLERINERQAYLVFRSTVRSDWFYYQGCYLVANDSACKKPQDIVYYAGTDAAGNQIFNPLYYNMNRVGFDATNGTWSVDVYMTPYVDVNKKYGGISSIKFPISSGIFDMNAPMSRVSDNVPFGYERPATPTYVPNPHTDLFPDQQAVEVIYPDPAVYPDSEQVVIENPDVVTNPNPNPTDPNAPPGTSDPPDPDDWGEKFKRLVTTKFPFSLPWDLAMLLGLFVADPIRPDIHVDEDFRGMPFKFDVTFEFLDPFMPFVRGVTVVGFVLVLIMSTSRLFGGAK